ncbi:hypothetical protein EUX98_g4826 [Antrodiella citrinella]|uniref:Uncharacterized protein n=1 Tax=Antrodiella citrinella TaxID=2447956 RepID=A0A4S4MT55_9APHY|nr:hypothetical protein EUX98_g4826 [Antrodiella citrinella]
MIHHLRYQPLNVCFHAHVPSHTQCLPSLPHDSLDYLLQLLFQQEYVIDSYIKSVVGHAQFRCTSDDDNVRRTISGLFIAYGDVFEDPDDPYTPPVFSTPM